MERMAKIQVTGGGGLGLQNNTYQRIQNISMKMNWALKILGLAPIGRQASAIFRLLR